MTLRNHRRPEEGGGWGRRRDTIYWTAQFDTYIMFTSGAAGAAWVPLQCTRWYFDAHVRRIPNGAARGALHNWQNLGSHNQILQAPTQAAGFPQWTGRIAEEEMNIEHAP